ncbi:hypothetical protein ES708_13879 [subsurface metagenome]
MEKCGSHKVVNGQVERSMKEEGKVIRKRRCDVCGELIKTIEMTEDQLVDMRVKFEIENRDIRAEMVHYRNVMDSVNNVFVALDRVKREMRIDHEIVEENQG